jgi:prevent-host-death family protein
MGNIDLVDLVRPSRHRRTVKTINVHEAKTHLSQILERVARGETVLLGKAGKPMAMLSPYAPDERRREPGLLKGKIWMADDFDAVDEEIADLFEADGPDD